MNKNFIAYIDNRTLRFSLGHTIMQGCNLLDIEIPKFCYHEKLSIAGNCRICLVEIDNSKKLVISCSICLSNNLNVKTNSLRVKKARQNVIEFLLINHPLDCPICDQGGECDLQDITILFGADRGRFYELKKKAVFDKNFGPLIKTSMNRCIHCTRCIRFISEISNNYVLGTINRGSNLEISTYIEKILDDELSGNIIDLCPVGALISKPYAFKFRSWELTSIQSIDILDSLNSNILIDISFNQVRRILPYLNEFINENWITNKARFSYDGLSLQRLNSCFLKINFSYFFKNHFNLNILIFSFIKISWLGAFKILTKKFFDKQINNLIVSVDNLIDLESLIVTKNYFNTIGINSLYLENLKVNNINIDYNFLYLFNASIKNFIKIPSFCLLIGTNIRLESPILNLKFRKMYYNYNIPIYSIGLANNYLNYKVLNISNNLKTIYDIFEFKHFFCKNFYKKINIINPFLLFGNFILTLNNGSQLITNTILFLNRIFKYSYSYIFKKFYKKINFNLFNNFGIIHNYSNQLNAFSIGFIIEILNKTFNLNNKKKTLIYLINSNFDVNLKNYLNLNFIVYQGYQIDNFFLEKINLILPTVNHIEKTSFFTNLEGIKQNTNLILKAPNNTKTNWAIFKAYLEYFLIFLGKIFFLKKKFLYFIKYKWNFFNSLKIMRENLNFFFLNINKNYIILNKDLFLKNSFFFFFSFKKKIINNYLNNYFEKMLICYFKNIKSLIFYNLINFSIINYYYDKSNLILISSKTMNTCSNFFLKKNFSFSQYLI